MIPAPLIKVLELSGSRNRMAVARWYNSLRNKKFENFRREYFSTLFQNQPLQLAMHEGWALDTTQSLPHLKALLATAQEIIREDRQVSSTKGFLIDMLTKSDIERCPALLDFATSPEMIATVSNYFGMVPVLSAVMLYKSVPTPVNQPISSQQFHLDIDVHPQVKVFVHIEDVSAAHGPFCFIPEPASKIAATRLNYGAARQEQRITDDQMYHLVDHVKLVTVEGAAGSVLFVDTSACFHYGSREMTANRYVVTYQYVTPTRTDFRQPSFARLSQPRDNSLRQMILNAQYLPPVRVASRG